MILFVQGYIEELHDLHDEFSDKEIIKKKRKKKEIDWKNLAVLEPFFFFECTFNTSSTHHWSRLIFGLTYLLKTYLSTKINMLHNKYPWKWPLLNTGIQRRGGGLITTLGRL